MQVQPPAIKRREAGAKCKSEAEYCILFANVSNNTKTVAKPLFWFNDDILLFTAVLNMKNVIVTKN
jgi:hypothetical protein